MKKSIKKLTLKKQTVTVLGNTGQVQAGVQAATQPVLSCRKACITLIPLCVP
ncbi:MAG: hypothetical protein JNM68_05255 [Dinghuibacter sp.]|nr:hypothetical protein [Dinghuibacter sp.]